MVEHKRCGPRTLAIQRDAGWVPRSHLPDQRAATVRSRISDLLATLPARVPRDDAASLVTRYFFRVSRRSLERWPVVVTVVNGRAHVETGELFRVAQGILDRAASVRGGRRT